MHKTSAQRPVIDFPITMKLTQDRHILLLNTAGKPLGPPIYATGKEFDIFLILALCKGKACSRTSILESVYSSFSIDEQPDDKIIDVLVSKLRTKLAAVVPDYNIICTIWGTGYFLPEIITIDIEDLGKQVSTIIPEKAYLRLVDKALEAEQSIQDYVKMVLLSDSVKN